MNENLEIQDLGDDLSSFFENEMESTDKDVYNDMHTHNDLTVYPTSDNTLAAVHHSAVTSDTSISSGVVGYQSIAYI